MTILLESQDRREGTSRPHAAAGHIWIASIAGTELLHFIPAHADDDPDEIADRVRLWIDRGMPSIDETL